jgi:hypothetical protein
VESAAHLHPQIDPGADVRGAGRRDHAPMTTSDYLIDSALVLLVLLQIKERRLTTKSMVRPLAIVGLAVVDYLHEIPTAGNDLVLVAVLGLLGLTIGLASGQTLLMRRDGAGEVLARAGLASALLWVLGMGARFAFALWATHGGGASLASFGAQHAITSPEAWTVALLAMAAFEVGGRTLLIALRRQRLVGRAILELA